jgi:hypothetical protein
VGQIVVIISVRDINGMGRIRIGLARNLIMMAAAAILIALSAIAPAGAQTIEKAKNMIEGVRDARYCEIIPVVRQGLRFVGTVYNTLGLNDCPPAIWDKITEPAMRKRFGASLVVLNGPRHSVMDAIATAGNITDGTTIQVDGLALTLRATIIHRLSSLRTKPYRERTIDRETRFVFKAGQPVFLLVRPDGARYAMQSYPEKSLSYADLPALGGRLKLPSGWRYETMTPAADLIVEARGRAVIVQDDLDDTYRKLD